MCAESPSRIRRPFPSSMLSKLIHEWASACTAHTLSLLTAAAAHSSPISASFLRSRVGLAASRRSADLVASPAADDAFVSIFRGLFNTRDRAQHTRKRKVSSFASYLKGPPSLILRRPSHRLSRTPSRRRACKNLSHTSARPSLCSCANGTSWRRKRRPRTGR